MILKTNTKKIPKLNDKKKKKKTVAEKKLSYILLINKSIIYYGLWKLRLWICDMVNIQYIIIHKSMNL